MTLPSGSAQLQYIESTGTQYVDTGFTPSGDHMRVVMEFEYSTVDAEFAGIFGAYHSPNSMIDIYVWRKSKKDAGRVICITMEQSKEIEIAPLERCVLDVEAKDGRLTYTAKTATQTISGHDSYSELYTGLPAYLFADNDDGSANPSPMRLYRCQIYDGETLARDYVPMRTMSSTVGLYDQVNRKFYSNKGTGTFVAGPMVMPDLVTDRTREDRDTLRSLLTYLGTEGVSAEAREAALKRLAALGNAKGAYNYTDLNRVELAVKYLAGRMRDIPGELQSYAEAQGVSWSDRYAPPWGSADYDLDIRPYWQHWHIPTASDMTRYLGNVRTVAEAAPALGTLEYTESDGAAYVDLQWTPSGADLRLELDFEMTKVGEHGLFGSGKQGASLDVYQNSKKQIAIRAGAKNMTLATAKAGTRYLLTATFSGGSATATMGDKTVTSVYSSLTSPYSACLFSDHYNGKADPSFMRLYGLRIWEDGVLIWDVTPACTAEDVPGVYDAVQNRFFANAGEGALIAGPVVKAPPRAALPETMDRLTIDGANAIEEALVVADEKIEDIRANRARRIDDTAWTRNANIGITAGEITAGE